MKMNNAVYVENVAERVPLYTGKGRVGVSMTLSFWEDDGAEEWWSQFNENPEFTFHGLSTPGVNAWYKLRDAVKERNKEKVKRLLKEIEPHRKKNSNDLTPLERWERTAYHFPGDIGGIRKEEEGRIITQKARGKVLETMCGFNSYFNRSPKISEVIVLDFCREMLERYEYPERKRVLFDLERVVCGEKMDFFKNGTFQTIGCWGSNYLSNQVPVFSEFYRILSKGDKFLILENTAEGYQDLIKRFFNPEKCARSMQEAGFKTKITELKSLKVENGLGDYFLVEGQK